MVYIGTYLFIGWPTEVALSGKPFFRGDLYEKLKLRLYMGLGDPYEILKLKITKNWGRWDAGAVLLHNLKVF